MGSANGKLIVAMAAVAALAVAFWMLLLSPRREEASKLSTQVSQARESLAQHSAEVATAEQARREFPVDYHQLVVLGKAVPGGDETASLLVQLHRIARNTKVRFQSFKLGTGGGEEAPAGEASATPTTPTEAAASLLPLGATIGPAGLAVMHYELTFRGNFFRLADFIRGLDRLVKTRSAKLRVRGRLFTVDGFSLAAASTGGFPMLESKFTISAYVTPPGAPGVTGGATPTAPAPSTATPASTTTGGSP
jgi:hypothetical protein